MRAQFLVTSTIAAGPTPVSATDKFFRKATLLARKSEAGGDAGLNTGDIYLGVSGAADSQPITMQPGDERTFTAEDMGKWNLRSYNFVVAADGDGLVVLYS